MRRIARIVGSAAAMAALLGGCDYFRPAKPEPPGEIFFTPDYSSVEATLQTISDAVGDKARTIGLTAYAGAFAESTTTSTPGFHAFFSDQDENVWIGSGHSLPADWNLPLERNFYIRFVGLRGDTYQLEWGPDDENPDIDQGPDVKIVSRHYVVRTLSETDQSVTSTLAIGFAELTFVRGEDSNWRIRLWRDRIDPNADPNDPEQITLGRRRLNTTQ